MAKRWTGWTMLLTGVMLVGLLVVLPGQSHEPWLEKTLQQSWRFYKNRFMVGNQRVLSNHYGGTITEGQSYAMLKAVWMDDPETFDSTWQWTRTHMRRPSDHLLGWRWGKGKDGVEKLLETENAVDADQDIAYALLLAGEKWHSPRYIADAKAMIHDLWRLNVVSINGKLYISPGTWPVFRQDYLTVNPSYFAPYVYKTFARYDSANFKGWQALADNIYPVLEACSDLTANKLPPNWCSVNWKDNSIGFSDKQGPGSRDFSYDAVRVFWRMAMDAAAGSPQARSYLANHRALLAYWDKHHMLPEGFTAEGKPRTENNSGFTLSAAVAQSHVLTPAWDEARYHQLLGLHYRPEGYWFNEYNDFLHSVIWLHLYTLTLPPA